MTSLFWTTVTSCTVLASSDFGTPQLGVLPHISGPCKGSARLPRSELRTAPHPCTRGTRGLGPPESLCESAEQRGTSEVGEQLSVPDAEAEDVPGLNQIR